MRINDSNEEAYQIEISKSPVLPRDTIAVSVSCRGTVYAVEAMRLADAPYVFQLPKSRLPAGCIQFTLYDKKGNILIQYTSFKIPSAVRSDREADLCTSRKSKHVPFT
jgi:hypothetical protein